MKFKLIKWSCCFPATSDNSSQVAKNCIIGKPELSNIPPMVKRRMPMVAKAMAALDDEIGGHHLPAVYASKNAELSRTIKLIRQFEMDLSPALFSMSVNNAIPGLLSVIRKNNKPYTVIDSLSGLLPMAFLEASNLLQDFEVVKVVVFEEQSSIELNQQFAANDPCFAAAFVISRGNELSLELLDRTSPETTIAEIDHGFQKDWLSFFNRESHQMEQVCRRQAWRWTWH